MARELDFFFFVFWGFLFFYIPTPSDHVGLEKLSVTKPENKYADHNRWKDIAFGYTCVIWLFFFFF